MLALICRTDKARFVLPAEAVARILVAADWLPLEGLPAGVVGVLNVAGTNLAVVDPRLRLQQSVGVLSLEHHFIEIISPRRFLLWVDAVEQSVEITNDQLERVATSAGSVALQLVRFDHETLPLLRPEVFDPGQLLSR